MVRQRAAIVLAVATAVLALAWTGLLTHGPVICPFRRLTGLPCASCGLTRAATALVHLDWANAFWLCPASLPLGLGAMVVLVVFLIELLSGKAIAAALWRRWSGIVGWLGVGCVVLSWAFNVAVHLREPL